MSRWILCAVCAFVVLFVLLLPGRLAVPLSKTFSNDAAGYDQGAIHLATQNFYSPDGVTPAVQREPGYSFFLSLIYRVFGIENRPAIFVLQGILHLLATLFFVRELRKITAQGAATVTAMFLLLLPSVFHIVLTPYRESFVLSLSLFFAGLFLSMRSHPTWRKAVLMGGLFSWIVLAHIPYLFMPLVILLIGWFLPLFPRRMLLPIIALPVVACLLWGARNEVTGGTFRMIGSYRIAAVLERRAIQASTFRLIDPFLCRWAEYITRDYSKASPYCGMRYGDVAGGEEVEKRIMRESESTMLHHVPSYVWDSLFFALEMHLPYVDGWGRIYNLLEALFTVVLYGGCLLSLRSIWKREYALFIAIILYSTALSALTEAIPRYHMVGLFCYATLAGVGYATFWTWLQARPAHRARHPTSV